MKKGDRVETRPLSRRRTKIVGTIAKNMVGSPYPFMVDVDLDESTLGNADKKHYKTHYAGPFRKDELVLRED